MNILIAGHGAYGSALGQVLLENGHSVTFYDPQYGDETTPVAFTVTDVIVIAVPSNALSSLMPVLNANYGNQPIILATKGVLNLSAFSNKLDQLSILSGPGFAEDIEAHHPTTLTATSKLAQELFSTDYISVEITDDIPGVLTCGALKNAYAIGAGLRHLQPKTPEFDTYISQSIAEIRELLPQFGGRVATADLACGLSDLILTCSGAKSRNYAFGFQLSQDPNYYPDQTTEGIVSLIALPDHLALPPIIADIKHRVLDR